MSVRFVVDSGIYKIRDNRTQPDIIRVVDCHLRPIGYLKSPLLIFLFANVTLIFSYPFDTCLHFVFYLVRDI